MQTRYLGTKRYSLEGEVALLPLLDAILCAAAEQGAEKAMLAMPHRGRLNVAVQIVGRDSPEIFARFEDVDPRSVLGSGDVKYHLGATGDFLAANGRTIGMHLVSNPSHLEAVDPVAIGRTRAKQKRRGEAGPRLVVPIIMHGDAAFAGQGILAETLNMAGVEGYTVGGSVHIIVNNLIGFTTVRAICTLPAFLPTLRSACPFQFSTSTRKIPKQLRASAESPWNIETNSRSSVVIDLIGYRRHGHSEVDDPTITQPLRYRKIEAHPPVWELYAPKTGIDTAPIVQRVRDELDEAQKQARELEKNPPMRRLPRYWGAFQRRALQRVLRSRNCSIRRRSWRKSASAVVRYPDGFHIHPKVEKLLEQRLEMAEGKRPLDYGMAEALAFGSLLREGVPVRLTGQDSRRGTFNQRHAALIDIENEQEYVPLEHLATGSAWCEIYNSTLSEASVLGFEYGFSRDFPEALVLWEAQFGDFANGAQIIIDQFIVAGEDKWNLLSGVVLLLPHGYEGQGPEHSSARIERFLQLAARDNIQICQPSSAAQYFHLLRRQALRSWRKPLIVFTPKSMLRNPGCVLCYQRTIERPVPDCSARPG